MGAFIILVVLVAATNCGEEAIAEEGKGRRTESRCETYVNRNGTLYLQEACLHDQLVT